MNKFKFNKFYLYLIILNIILIIFRIKVGDYLAFRGDLWSVLIFISILATLSYLFITKKYDYFVLFWLSFHFACPIITLPFTTIGSLGILDGIFLPLMLLKTFDLKNKYFLTIFAILLICLLHMSEVSARIILSSIIEIIAPLVFFYFVIKKCKSPQIIIWGAIIIALMSIPLSLYQIATRPAGGVFEDWRGIRIFGSLFWPNSYSIYLLAPIITLYALLRIKFNQFKFWAFLSLFFVNIFTFSRIGLLTMLIGFLFFEFFYKGKSNVKFKKISLVLLALILISSYFYYFESLGPRLRPESISERTEIWGSILPYVQNNYVFGNGIGSYELYRNQIIYSLSPHNYYLDIIFEIGIVGLILILIFVIFISKEFIKKINKRHHSDFAALGLTLIMALLTVSFVGSGFSQVSALNAWVVLGCLMISNEGSDNRE